MELSHTSWAVLRFVRESSHGVGKSRIGKTTTKMGSEGCSARLPFVLLPWALQMLAVCLHESLTLTCDSGAKLVP